MAISDTARKLLWARAHNRCALCRESLTVDADSARLPGLILGEEAHIVAQSEYGPRGHEDRSDIDGYPNLILLCADYHKRVDDQPDVFTADELRARKIAHERWAEEKFAGEDDEPMRLVKQPGEDAIQMHPVATGVEVWDLVSGAGLFSMRSIRGDDDTDASDAADEFLTRARDTGMIADAIQDDGFVAVRQAQRTLQEMLTGLWERDMFVYGRRVTRTLTGGKGAPQPFIVTHLVVLAADELRERGGFAEEVPEP